MDAIASWLGPYRATLGALALTAGALVVTWIAVALFRRLLTRLFGREGLLAHFRPEAATIVMRIASTAAWFIAVLVILEIWDVGIGGMWAVLASGLAVIGVGMFATWTIISNITANVFIAIWRPFQLGDVVEILPEGLKGRAIEQNMMFVVLREEAGTIIQVPNNQFFQKMIRVQRQGDPSLFEVLEAEDAGKTRESG